MVRKSERGPESPCASTCAECPFAETMTPQQAKALGHVNSAFERASRACRMIAVAEDGSPNRTPRLLGWVRQTATVAPVQVPFSFWRIRLGHAP